MSYDGWPPNLQSFCSKICLRSQNLWTLIQKMHFSIYSPVTIGPRVPKSVPEGIKTRPAKFQIGAWMLLFGARFFTKLKASFWPETRRPNAPVQRPKCFCLKSKISLFCVLSAPFSWWITLNITWKISTKLVMTECHHLFRVIWSYNIKTCVPILIYYHRSHWDLNMFFIKNL